MTIPIWSHVTGTVFLRNFDHGVLTTMGAVVVNNPKIGDEFQLTVMGATNTQVKVFFAKPEQVFEKKIFPMITVDRDWQPAMHRWMGQEQLEYRAGVSGSIIVSGGVSGFGMAIQKPQAFPYDITYTISCFDRYEWGVQPILLKLLKVFRPTSTLFLTDSLEQRRSYDMFLESTVPLHEVIDAVTRVRGYALTVRVLGELDEIDPVVMPTVSGIDIREHAVIKGPLPKVSRRHRMH